MKLVLFILISFIYRAMAYGDTWSYISYWGQRFTADLLFGNCPDLKKFAEHFKLPTDTSNVKLNLYTKNGSQIIKTSFPIATAGKEILRSPYFNINLPIVIYCHGYIETTDFLGTVTNTNAFLEKGGYNVMAVNAHSMIGMIYLLAAKAVEIVGEALGKVILDLIDGGVFDKHIYLVGFSLGAHIVGLAGQKVIANGKMVDRITGLDPAGPCFRQEAEHHRLSTKDAAFVDIIHTDGGSLGMADPIGDVDFFPNAGFAQPGAFILSFSHLRAFDIFVESITNPTAFPAVKCLNWDEFINDKCSHVSEGNMGYYVDRSARGSYYLWTRSLPPYSAGKYGIRYNYSPMFNMIIG